MYQTSLLSFHIFTSQGVYLVHDSITQQNLSYSMIIMVLSYILHCGSNLLEPKLAFISFFTLLVFFLSVVFFSTKTFYMLKRQRETVFNVGQIELISTVNSKIFLFIFVCLLQFLYFGLWILGHFLYKELSFQHSEDNDGVYYMESCEFIVVGILFFLLRARPLAPFFLSDIDYEADRVIPFYYGDSKCFSGGIALIQFPRKISLGVLVK